MKHLIVAAMLTTTTKSLHQLTSELPAEIKAALAGFATGFQLQRDSEFSTMTATLRYDYDTNIAIKGEVNRLSNDLNSVNDSTLF